mmetsp:Transcript_21435/g.46567  ORF Transcript_21435/g.46567 Transcript_21435/m.46567 type:complete len:259 (-) Transcript_21435:60-836(-)
MESEEQEWVEAPNGWSDEEDNGDGDGDGMLDLFGNDDPHQCFTFQIKTSTTATKNIRLNGFKLHSDETDHSTGVTLWQAAPRLADYLQENAMICKGKSILELGAGLGLCGITAHYLGAKSVMMTDGDTPSLLKMRENVRQNCGAGDAMSTENNTIVCRQLFWGSPHMEKFLEHGKYDMILGADVIYTPPSVQPLLDTVACLLKPHGQFVLSRYNKWNNVDDEVVIEAAKQRCLVCTQPSEGIYVFHWNENSDSGDTHS